MLTHTHTPQLVVLIRRSSSEHGQEPNRKYLVFLNNNLVDAKLRPYIDEGGIWSGEVDPCVRLLHAKFYTSSDTTYRPYEVKNPKSTAV